jgi:phage gp29-like protein
MTSEDEPADELKLAERDNILHAMGMDLPKSWLFERHNIPLPAEGEPVVPGGTGVALGGFGSQPLDPKSISAKDASSQIADTVIEDLSGVKARWLGGVKPYFTRLVMAARDGRISDDDLLRTVERAHSMFPELFPNLDTMVLVDALEKRLGAATVNGAIKGAMARPMPERKLLT